MREGNRGGIAARAGQGAFTGGAPTSLGKGEKE